LRSAGLWRSGSPSVPRLLATRREAEAILQMVPQPGALRATGFEASRTLVLSPELSDYRILHFATHAVMNDQEPDLSGLLMSMVTENGAPQNGFVRVSDIYGLSLNADMVVLSACETALGKTVRGEGLLGFVRGFMSAGTPRVVASSWKVEDEATAALMRRFYTGLFKDHLRPAAALRAAQLELMADPLWHSPFYWAAFTLHGDWR
jgi:CHAT domain-containing protein